MIRYSSVEMKMFCKDRYPNKTFQESVKKLKEECHLTVLNRGHSKNKTYLVCESIL